MKEKNIKYIQGFNLIPETDRYSGWSEDVYIKENNIYSKDNILIATIDENEQIIFEEEYLEKLQNLIEEKFGGLMDFNELGLQDEDRKIYIQKLMEENDKDILTLTEEELVKKIANEDKTKETLAVEESKERFSEEKLIKSGNGWEEFTHIIKVKETDAIYEDFPDLEKPLFIGYDKSGNFVANTMGENDEPVRSEVISSARSTMREVIHIDDDGEEVKEMVPSAVMDTRKDNMKVSLKIGQYGYIEAQKIQIGHDNKWIATDIDKVGSYDKIYDVKYETDLRKKGKCGNEEIGENFEEQEKAGDNKIELDEVKHTPNNNINPIKREIIELALEQYEEMSREELINFIIDNLRSRVKDDSFDIDEIAKDIKAAVEEEIRFPTRGEREDKKEDSNV